jgi:hypothetical protein
MNTPPTPKYIKNPLDAIRKCVVCNYGQKRIANTDCIEHSHSLVDPRFSCNILHADILMNVMLCVERMDLKHVGVNECKSD